MEEAVDRKRAPDSTTARTFLDAGFSDAYAEAEDDAGGTCQPIT